MHHVVIDRQHFPVPQRDLGAVQDALLCAVREGGAFVRLDEGARTVDVLVSPCTSVRLEHTETSDDGSRQPPLTTSPGDVDWWLESA